MGRPCQGASILRGGKRVSHVQRSDVAAANSLSGTDWPAPRQVVCYRGCLGSSISALHGSYRKHPSEPLCPQRTRKRGSRSGRLPAHINSRSTAAVDQTTCPSRICRLVARNAGFLLSTSVRGCSNDAFRNLP